MDSRLTRRLCIGVLAIAVTSGPTAAAFADDPGSQVSTAGLAELLQMLQQPQGGADGAGEESMGELSGLLDDPQEVQRFLGLIARFEQLLGGQAISEQQARDMLSAMGISPDSLLGQ